MATKRSTKSPAVEVITPDTVTVKSGDPVADLLSLPLNTNQHGDAQIRRWIADADTTANDAARAVMAGHVILASRDPEYLGKVFPGESGKASRSRLTLVVRAVKVGGVTDARSAGFAAICDAAAGLKGSNRAALTDRVKSAEANPGKATGLRRTLSGKSVTAATLAPAPTGGKAKRTKATKSNADTVTGAQIAARIEALTESLPEEIADPGEDTAAAVADAMARLTAALEVLTSYVAADPA